MTQTHPASSKPPEAAPEPRADDPHSPPRGLPASAYPPLRVLAPANLNLCLEREPRRNKQLEVFGCDAWACLLPPSPSPCPAVSPKAPPLGADCGPAQPASTGPKTRGPRPTFATPFAFAPPFTSASASASAALSTPPPPPPPPLIVTIGESIGRGRLFHAFHATIVVPALPGRPLRRLAAVAKLVNVPHTSEYRFDDALDAIRRGAAVLAGPLHALQGTVVPRFYGLWHCAFQTACPYGGGAPRARAGADWEDEVINHKFYLQLEEACGAPLAPLALRDPTARDAALAALRRIHACGVVQNDMAPSHILRHPADGRPRFIDFEGALLYDPAAVAPADWDAECRDEHAMLELLLERPAPRAAAAGEYADRERGERQY